MKLYHRVTKAVIGEFADSTMREAVEYAARIDADLSGAKLRGAKLSVANLSGADLRRADLRRADLRGADLRRAILPGRFLLPTPHEEEK